MSHDAKAKVKRAQLSTVVIRADGSKVNLGVVSDSAKHWRYGPGKWLARRRTNRANRKVNK